MILQQQIGIKREFGYGMLLCEAPFVQLFYIRDLGPEAERGGVDPLMDQGIEDERVVRTR